MNSFARKFLALIHHDSNAHDQTDWFRVVKTAEYSFLKITFKFITYRGERLNAILYFPTTWNEVKRAFQVFTA